MVQKKNVKLLKLLYLLEMPKKRTLNFQKSWFYLFQWKSFKNDKRFVLSHLKNFFFSKDI